MKSKTYAVIGLLMVIAACSASGTGETAQQDARDDAGNDARAPELDAEPADDADPTIDPDAERPLVCGDAGFCETRLPRSELGLPLSLRSVWAVGSKDVWSVSVEGFVLHYDGTSWTTAYKANHELYAVWATPTSVWVGGAAGLLFHRSNGGEWSRVETGHVAPIRSIAGTHENDVWFTSHGGSVDHFDGTTLTHYPIDVPGLEITTVFGRPGFGAYAAGYVKGALPRDQIKPFPAYVVPDQPYVFALSTSNISVFSTTLTETRGFVPMSGIVLDSPNDDRRIFMVGYQHQAILAYNDSIYHYPPMKYCVLGAAGPLTIQDIPVGFTAQVDVEEIVVQGYPLLSYRADDIRILWQWGALFRWDGNGLSFGSLAMGYDFAPGATFGAHAHMADAWIVGDGFALKGSTP